MLEKKKLKSNLSNITQKWVDLLIPTFQLGGQSK